MFSLQILEEHIDLFIYLLFIPCFNDCWEVSKKNIYVKRHFHDKQIECEIKNSLILFISLMHFLGFFIGYF